MKIHSLAKNLSTLAVVGLRYESIVTISDCYYFAIVGMKLRDACRVRVNNNYLRISKLNHLSLRLSTTSLSLKP